MKKIYDELYKLDSKGKTRVWFMEQDGGNFRAHDGTINGKVKCSGWKKAKATNVGRANERQPVEQATFEIEARYKNQLKGSYYTDIKDINLGCRYIEPMLADKYKKFKVGEAQPKLDGFRCAMSKAGPTSRNGEIIPGAKYIHDELLESQIFERFPGLILDGELYNHDYASDFGGLQSLLTKENPTEDEIALIKSDVQYHVYDIISSDIRSERFMNLDYVVRVAQSEKVILVESKRVETESEYDDIHGAWVELGYEGSMWRDSTMPYEEGSRSKGLLKRKDFDDAEFEIVEIQEGRGNWAGAAKRVVCWLPEADRTGGPTEKNTFEAGLRGTYPNNVKLLAERDKHKIVTIRYFGYTTTAIPKPRFGVATHFWGEARTL